MNKYINNMFSVGVIIAGIGSTGYQITNSLMAEGQLWTLLPGLIVILLALITIKTQKIGPAIAGYTIIIPISIISLIGLLVPLSPEARAILPIYYLMMVIMIIGITLSTYIGVKAIIKIMSPS